MGKGGENNHGQYRPGREVKREARAISRGESWGGLFDGGGSRAAAENGSNWGGRLRRREGIKKKKHLQKCRGTSRIVLWGGGWERL